MVVSETSLSEGLPNWEGTQLFDHVSLVEMGV